MQIFDQVPLLIIFLITIFMALLCVEGGFKLGRCKAEEVQQAAVGPMVASMLSLLAFMLTFTFGLAAARYDVRRVLVLEEANAIGTTYLRADFIEEPGRTKVKNLLREYIDVRINDALPENTPSETPPKAEVLQDALWQQAAMLGQKHPDSKVGGLFIDSLNQMIDLQAKRVAARLQARVPESIWFTLFLIAAIAMVGTGYNCGIVGKRSLLTGVMLSIVFSAVMVLVVDLDRPGKGFIHASQQAMIDLSKKVSSARSSQ